MSKYPCVDLVIFDLYGTLVQFGVMHHPFRELLKWAREHDRKVKDDDARSLMTTDANMFQLALHLDIQAPDDLLIKLQKSIEEELASLTLFSDVIPTLTKIQSLGVPIAICSNLAQPYGDVINRLLPQFELLKFLSYEVGFIKPEPEIYRKILLESGFKSESCLFVGDTFIADYDGPVKNGFQARHLVRNQRGGGHQISTLNEIIELI
ncbi:MAG TPA: HAD family hydrolase [Cellvibrio sp.]|nr:HAD family hydrolase [Cellvibrio sp.]